MESINKLKESNGSLSLCTIDFMDFSFRSPPAVEGVNDDGKLFQHAGFLPSKPAMAPPPTAAVSPNPKVPPLSHRRAELLCSNVPRRLRAYERLRRASSDSTSEAAGRKRPWRLLCVLGVVRFPAEIEMKDMKSRQRRLGPSELMPERVQPRIPWFILQSLSCRAAESTAVSPFPAAAM